MYIYSSDYKQVYLNSKIDGNAVFCTLNHSFSKHSAYCKCLSGSVCTNGMFAASCKQKKVSFNKKEFVVNRRFSCAF